jgi:hypothetical protein
LSRISFGRFKRNGNDTQKIFLDAAVQANVQRFIQTIIQPILQT